MLKLWWLLHTILLQINGSALEQCRKISIIWSLHLRLITPFIWCLSAKIQWSKFCHIDLDETYFIVVLNLYLRMKLKQRKVLNYFSNCWCFFPLYMAACTIKFSTNSFWYFFIYWESYRAGLLVVDKGQ